MSDTLRAAPARRLPDWAAFLAAWARAPLATGAIAPSGAVLARRVAAEVPIDRPGPVVELGPGTGALTEPLAARVGQRRLILVERDRAFCRRLAARFPEARVVEGDAAELPRLLAGGPAPAAVVSGLPLCSLPRDLGTRIVAGALAAAAGGRFVQFSYLPRFPLRGPWRAERTAIVWRNLPPAFVFVVRP